MLVQNPISLPGKSSDNAVAAIGPKPVYTYDQIAEYLVSGFAPQERFDASEGDVITVKMTGLTADGQQLARWALEAWSDATGLVFVEITEGTPDILFDDIDPSGAYSFSTTNGDEITFSYVNVPVNWINNYGTTIDSYSLQTYIHEIGHALGLGHAGPYNGSAFFLTDALYANDSWQATIMSYFSQDDNPNIDADFAYIITPMIADLLAMDIQYGGTTTTNLGDTVYGVNSNVGGYMGDLYGILFDGDPADPNFYDGGPVAFTINDDGGIDTLDFSSVSDDQNLNLNPETISDIMGLTGNLTIARDTVIENGSTGSGNDTLIGNDAANILNSGDGRDRVEGGAGGDAIDAGGDIDIVLGGEGEDDIDGGDALDILVGGDDADTVSGGEGNDWVIGGEGSDRLIGGNGDDQLIGGTEADVFEFTASGAAETDRIRDFEDGVDLIEFTDVGGFGDLTITNVSGGAEVSVGNLDIIVLGVSAGDLTEDDFQFAPF